MGGGAESLGVTVDATLARLGLSLPAALSPDASFRAVTRQGDTLYVSGQLPRGARGTIDIRGRLGAELTVEQGNECARVCALHLLAQVRAELGSLDRVRQILKLQVYVASAPAFDEQHLVANGASDLLAAVLGAAGRHARSALGVASLPLGSPIEIDAIVGIHPGSEEQSSRTERSEGDG
jgi:enamine deaminase RidA (YjgF/YER057c/UK114 family)